MLGGIFTIFAIIFYFIFVTPVLKYYREHQATPQKGMYMQNGEKVISGYVPIEMELMLMENRRHSRDPQNIPSIYPLDKIDFLNYNSNAKKEYTECLVRAIAWSHGYIPLSKCLMRYIDPFKSYNKQYKWAEETYYNDHECIYRDDPIKRREKELEYKEYGFVGRISSFKFDVRDYWKMDYQR